MSQQFLKALCGLLFTALAGTVNCAELPTPTLAPGYGNLQFTAPPPDSYTLPTLGKAADGKVLDTEGKDTTLHALMGDNSKGADKIVLLSFIYATCSDVNGCPLATTVLHKINSRLQKEPELAKKLRLLTLSFNPEHDTPAQMKHYGESLQDGTLEWHFLTTRSEQELNPILTAYQQNIQKIYDDKGQDTGTFSHVLRVYLIDQHQQIRNIYSLSFLHPDTVINDIKSLLHTQSAKATEGKVKKTDVLKTVHHAPLGLPPVSFPKNNPISKEKVSLGKKLFFDRRLSLNNTMSCAMCHIADQGFTNNQMATAVGAEGRTVRRNSPSLYNTAYFTRLFHDGRETELEQQVWLPLLTHNEMANPSIGYVIDKINASTDYAGLFQKAFKKPASMETVGMALASYERTLNSANSQFDRWQYGHDKQALDTKAQRGLQLFTGKAGCSQCHTIGDKNALFTDNGLHNTGIGYQDAMVATDKNQRVQLAPDVYVDVDSKLIDSVSATKTNDLGRYEITQDPQDRWKYKTPSLRNISLTAPYMHNGSLATLQDVITFYNQGGVANENLDPLIKPLHLTDEESKDLEHFLTQLTGDNVQEVIDDAQTAPIGDMQ
ncbi:Methylamine utilization protein MauG [Crenothrix polyspora]|uniref:Methylamine utilization protein MauG n=1 Tax=Crenothrix polyspora TaxID=360316 RepID=A0A1R4HH64_9GAMM|nr:cytochrome c peroxidase [Crenothrix polyspora]SJM95588.1 Methylamine utilization protein MauG [Crenothrix polyspora]